MEVVLTHAYHDSIASHNHQNAIFLAERLQTHFPSEDSIRYLAEAFIASGELHRAFSLTRGCASHANRYVFAFAAMKINKLQEAEQALSPGADGLVPNGAFGHHLLGEICRRADRPDQAVYHFKQCVAMNPLIWTAYENLCQLGVDVDASGFFGPENVTRISQLTKFSEMHQPLNTSHPSNTSSFLRPNTSHNLSFTPLGPAPPGPLDVHSTPGNITSSPRLSFGPTIPGSVDSTPFAPTHPHHHSIDHSSRPPIPHHEAHIRVGLSNVGFTTPSPPTVALSTPPNTGAHRLKGPPIKKYMSIGGSAGITKRPTRAVETKKDDRVFAKKLQLCHETTTIDFPASPNVSANTATTGNTSAQNSSPDVTQTIFLFKLFSSLGNVCRHRMMYRCDEALATIADLPPSEQRSGLVLCEMGRALFDVGRHRDAYNVFVNMRKADPNRLNGLEIFSSVLWFLKKDHDLSALAQEVVGMSKLAPETWCVLGNCFSLQREYDTALKFFARAVQVDPYFSYGHTLAGHEYTNNEEYEKALGEFRSAIRCDSRHYNAWFGLGSIYLKQQKVDLSIYHFKRASDCNGRNSVLMCQMGVALQANGRNKDALDMFETAIALDKTNSIARLHRASVLILLQRHLEALSELELLREEAPRESQVYLKIGDIYKYLGNTNEALINYNLALDLDPKSLNAIKAAIDRLQIVEQCVADESM